MSKLSVDQTSISKLFSDRKSDFLIPDYQRPYAWSDEECQTLWDDILEFAMPDNNSDLFNQDEEYYLGPIVTFKNNNKKEIIDGQQRLTTLMLLLRAFYVRCGRMQESSAKDVQKNIGQCIWKTDEFDKPNFNELKINSEVATDDDKSEFLKILKDGDATGMKSKYAKNYRFFQQKIDEFLNAYPTSFLLLPIRIMKNCILLPIEAEDQNTALRIFSTLNDRGLPLSDADIFKAQYYNYYSAKGKKEKEEFVENWKELEKISSDVFYTSATSPMNEVFTRYMYYLRAKQGTKLSTTEALRKFYERNKYELLKNNQSLEDLKDIAVFWQNVMNQDSGIFSSRILKKLYVLKYAPNGMWTYFVTVYFMQNKDGEEMLDEENFYNFLNKITAFIWAYAVTNPGVNALRTPVFAEMINIVTDQEVTFSSFKFDKNSISNSLYNYQFNNNRPITKSMLTWWAFENEKQESLLFSDIYEIEHIYSKKRQDIEKTLSSSSILECLGNKCIIEKNINIRASDYKFEDKKRHYMGYKPEKGDFKNGSKIYELLEMHDKYADYTEVEIISRNKCIIDSFIEYLNRMSLLKI